jgi:hypothetical protein
MFDISVKALRKCNDEYLCDMDVRAHISLCVYVCVGRV